VAAQATALVQPGTGHWVMGERPKKPADPLMKFL
jgi:hypothetical protein